MKVEHQFVDLIPDELQDGVLYVTLRHGTAVHKCACGCGHQVVTPLSPTGWSLTYNGETVSLDPSIGNWSFPCKSHYWIIDGEVVWSRTWSAKEIDAVRARDAAQTRRYYRNRGG